jgi:hypothetical protein
VTTLRTNGSVFISSRNLAEITICQFLSNGQIFCSFQKRMTSCLTNYFNHNRMFIVVCTSEKRMKTEKGGTNRVDRVVEPMKFES